MSLIPYQGSGSLVPYQGGGPVTIHQGSGPASIIPNISLNQNSSIWSALWGIGKGVVTELGRDIQKNRQQKQPQLEYPSSNILALPPIPAAPSVYPVVDWSRQAIKAKPRFGVAYKQNTGVIPWGPGLYDSFSGGGLADPFLII